MYIWKWANLSKIAGFNISLSLNERQSSSDKKHNKSLRLVLFFPFCCCFAGSLPFSLSTVKQMNLFHSIPEMFFTFLARKTLLVKLFSLNVCEAALQAAIKGGNFGAKLAHLCGFWLDVSFFSHGKKHRSRFWLDVSFFLTSENHCLLLWLARTNLRTEIYNIAFWWVFLSMYIIKIIVLYHFNCLLIIANFSRFASLGEQWFVCYIYTDSSQVRLEDFSTKTINITTNEIK